MVRKFFPLDKNYLLEEAQVALQESLLAALIEKVKSQYQLQNNPLGLRDEFSSRIMSWHPGNLQPLSAFYETLSGIYRYKFGDNQLELLWGGETHFEKYKRDWSGAFEQWTNQFCTQEQFVQAILDLTVFLPVNRQVQLAENRMNFVMLQFFDLKVHKNRGIVEVRVA